ncbi:substrate-binding domain-containing protein [Sphaerisporangium siamense]|uniref:ABC-type phosphate transport system substrate-binding protein n=1 Tax=Sphaerisporangium siamense TaxID=795645 RepID=A0A7W7D1L5_9ACTN|nr:substrate-binding domain-containing protein [Sphaerisporangium siamense]MBB4698597.1 ABC-type phosphate transport system substrate-binding protein [Sphaerisporangium siamense]
MITQQRRMGRTLGAAACAVAAITLTAPAAQASASSSSASSRADLVVGVGSDTTEVLFDKLARHHNRGPAARGRVVNHWATGTPTITPKPGCAPIPRPNGSSPGIAALATRGTAADGSPCLDFARSVAPRSPGAPADAVFYPVARDGLSWASNESGNAPASLTVQQVADILECDAVRWDQVGGTSRETIDVYLPERGPGLVGLLRHLVGVERVGDCVGVTQQDDGTTPEVKDNPNALVFYSIGKYIGQTVHHRADVHGDLRLGLVGGVAPTVRDPATGRVEINLGQVPGVAGLPESLRITEWVAVRKDADGTVPPKLARLFSGPGSWLCASPVARRDIRDHGFLPMPDGACGVPS